MNCEKEVKKLYEISISISAPCWMSNGHIKICKTCYDIQEEDHSLFYDSDKNYKRFGDIYCPTTPASWSRKRMQGWTGEGFESCTRACFDSRWYPMEGCKCVHCLTKTKWMKAKLVPKYWRHPEYSSKIETECPYDKK